MEETKKCPYCGEEILAVAKKCKHCGEWLEEEYSNEDGAAIDEINKVTEDRPQPPVETQSKFPWKVVVIKVVGCAIFMALCIWVFNLCSGDKVPSMEGTWSYGNSYTIDYFEGIDGIKEVICTDNNTDEFLEDHTEIDRGVEEYQFFIESERFTGVVTLKYETTYSGTWRQKDNKVFLSCTDYKWKFLDASIEPQTEMSSALYTGLTKVMEEELFPDCKEFMLSEEREQTIVDVDYDKKTITLEEEGDTFVMEKIDGDIKKIKSSKAVRSLRHGKEPKRKVKIRR